MSTSFKQPLITLGPRVRKSPFFNATLRYGAKAFTIYNHTYMPTCYSDPVSEYWSLVRDVTLWDVTCQRLVEISGPDALKLIQLLTPRDMSRCQVHQCQYLLLTDEDGGIVNDAVMLRIDEDCFWLSPGDGDTLLWALGVAVHSGLDVSVREPGVSTLQLQGPKSPLVARELFGDAVLELGYYWMKEAELDGIPLYVSRTGWSGELGFELYLSDSNRGEELWEMVMEAGRPHNIAPTSPNTIRSIEGGLLSYDSDLTRDDNAFLIGVGKLIDLEQADDFIGKNALQKIQAEGVQRHLAGIEIKGEALSHANEEFWAVMHEGQRIGHVTRCVHSPRLDRNIGFANIPIGYADIGTELTLATPDGERVAVVCEWPWFPAQVRIPQELKGAA